MADRTGIERPALTLSHLRQCDGINHLDAIGDGPGEAFEYHGESGDPAAVYEQCMCGHFPYYSCPDWLGVHNLTEACKTGEHDDCDRRAEVEYTGEVQDEACPCECHAVPAHLLNTALPQRFTDRFSSWEQFERDMQAELGTDAAILRDRRGNTTIGLPLTVLRARVEETQHTSAMFDVDDWGGCGCFTEEESADV